MDHKQRLHEFRILACRYLDNELSAEELTQFEQYLQDALLRAVFIDMVYNLQVVKGVLARQEQQQTHFEPEEQPTDFVSEMFIQQLEKQKELDDTSARLKAIAIEKLRTKKTSKPKSESHPSYQSHTSYQSESDEQQRGVIFSLAGVNLFRGENSYGMKLRKRYFAAAAMIALLVVIGYQHYVVDSDKTVIQPKPPIVATLNRTLDAQWENIEQVVGEGGLMRAGSYKLLHGFAEIMMERGTKVLVEGPCTIDLQDDNTVHLQSGQLVAVVPDEAKGFTVFTPTAKIIDYGTEFGVKAKDNGQTDVAVFRGEVEMDSQTIGVNAGESVRMTVGQSGRVEQLGGAIVPHPLAMLDFVRPEEFEVKVKAKTQSPYYRWLAQSYELRHDPSLVAYYTMATNDQGQLENQVDDILTDRASDATVNQTQRVEGRFGDHSQSLNLEHPQARVDLNIPGTYQDITLIAWIKMNPTHTADFRAILYSENYLQQPGTVHWHIYNSRQIRFGLSTGLARAGEHFYLSDSVENRLNDGRWHQVATVLDFQQRQVRHYLDGQSIGTETLRYSKSLVFGLSNLGNWTVSVEKQRVFGGNIDELMFFKRAMSSEEILRLHERTKGGGS